MKKLRSIYNGINKFVKCNYQLLDITLKIFEIVFIGIFINWGTKNIMNKQLEIEQIKVRPSFSFCIEREKGKDEKYDTYFLYTMCTGNSYTDYVQDIKTVLVLEGKFGMIEFPLYGFWFAHRHYNYPTNGIIRKSGYENNFAKFLSIYRDLEEHYNISSYIDTYISINYKDILKNSQNEFYKIPHLSNDVHLISENEFNRVFGVHNKLLEDSVDIDKDTAVSIYEKTLKQ